MSTSTIAGPARVLSSLTVALVDVATTSGKAKGQQGLRRKKPGISYAQIWPKSPAGIVTMPLAGSSTTVCPRPERKTAKPASWFG